MAKLIVKLEDGRSREYDLAEVTSVGRHPNQAIQVLDRLVSKAHLVLRRQEDGWVVHELGSLNGTYLNDRQVTGVVPISHKDVISVGTTQLVFRDEAGSITGTHRVAIGDALESSICESINQPTADDFLPGDLVTDVNVLRRDYEHLRIAALLSREISLELRLERLLPRIIDQLFALFKADRGVILLREEQGGPLKPRAVRVRGRQNSTEPIAISQTILKRVLGEKEGVLTHDAQRDDRFAHAKSIIIQGIRSSMCVPLLARDRSVIGVIHVDSLLVTNAFTEKDLNMLQGVAHHAAIAIENSLLVQRIEAEAVTRQKFEKMLSPNLVERVVSGDLRIEKGGEPRDATVMFTDIRGFTPLAETMPPQELVKLLNEYFELVVDVVFEFDGTLDKYIGDSVMAFWGAPVEDPEAPRKAVLAALEIQNGLRRFNSVRELDALLPVETGIGIDAGPIVAGYMGSSKTMSYTVIGPHVNVASRLCSQAVAGETLLSANVRRLCGDDIKLETRDPLLLKGISEPVENWAIGAQTRRVATRTTDTDARAAKAAEELGLDVTTLVD